MVAAPAIASPRSAAPRTNVVGPTEVYEHVCEGLRIDERSINCRMPNPVSTRSDLPLGLKLPSTLRTALRQSEPGRNPRDAVQVLKLLPDLELPPRWASSARISLRMRPASSLRTGPALSPPASSPLPDLPAKHATVPVVTTMKAGCDVIVGLPSRAVGCLSQPSGESKPVRRFR